MNQIKSGIYYDMPAEEYHAAPGLSQSGMKHLAISPLRYWHKCLNPQREPEEETVAQRVGSALHCAALESDEVFERRYACELDKSLWDESLDTMGEIREWIKSKGHTPKGTRKDDAIAQAKAIMEITGERIPIAAEEEKRFYAQNEGKQILSLDEWSRVAGMTQALAAEPQLAKILSEGRAEVSIFATDPDTGVPLKVRLDWMAPAHTVDLKSFTQMRGKSIDKSIGDAIYYERYWVQAYLYHMVRKLAQPDVKFDTVYAFVESEQPHETRLKSFRSTGAGGTNLYWDMARLEVLNMCRLYADCFDRYRLDPWRSNQTVQQLTDDDVKQFSFS
jgi:hypothetical protein